MLSRRGILGAILSTTGAAASGLSPRDVLAAAQGMGATTPLVAGIGATSLGEKVSVRHEHRYRLRRVLERRMDDLARASMPLPPHIASKRSWSLAFKASEATREWVELRAAQEALENDDVVERLMALLE